MHDNMTMWLVLHAVVSLCVVTSRAVTVFWDHVFRVSDVRNAVVPLRNPSRWATAIFRNCGSGTLAWNASVALCDISVGTCSIFRYRHCLHGHNDLLFGSVEGDAATPNSFVFLVIRF